MPPVIADTQLPPVQGGLGRRNRRGLSQRGLGIDVRIAVVRMLLAKIVAGMDFGFPCSETGVIHGGQREFAQAD